MGKVRKDLTGMVFGRLIVVGRAPDYISKSGRVRTMWYCKCICDGKIIICETSNLTTGHTKSCGCLQKEQTSKAKRGTTYFEIIDNVAIGYTSKNEQFFVDADKVPLLCKQSWWYTKQGYIMGDIDGEHVLLHRFLTNCDEEHVVDHKNHITGDNRLCNLRVCTVSENQYNRVMQKNNKSNAIGVCWDKTYSKWRAYITVKKKRIELGYFNFIDDAIRARTDAEQLYHKEFAFNNNAQGCDI